MSSQQQEVDTDWEEWDGKSPFYHHCLAGSMAGVAEHVLVYPIDTVKTHLQACSACPANAAPKNAASVNAAAYKVRTAYNTSASESMWGTMRYLVTTTAPLEEAAARSRATTTGFPRLWRGAQTIMLGCIPAHALYFGIYEGVKQMQGGELTYVGSLVAGGTATVGHDVIMTSFDTVKQRLQLGHYTGLSQAFSHMVQNEGSASLFRSFPVTLLTNIPYGMTLVAIKEHLEKQHLSQDPLANTLIASSIAGATAAGVTTPLDRVKTLLQTQHLKPTCVFTQGTCPKITTPEVVSWREAVQMIVEREGAAGFFRGLAPRVMSHTPAVAISWTSYSVFQQWLAKFA